MISIIQRFLIVYLITLSGIAIAQPTANLIWTDSPGATGTNVTRAEVNDILLMDIWLTDGGSCTGLYAASASISWEPTKLSLLSAEICPKDPVLNPTGPGECADPGSGALMYPFTPLQIGSSNVVLGFNALTSTVPGYLCGATMLLGRAEFQVVGSGTTKVRLFYRPDLDGIQDGNLAVSEPAAEAATILPPGCGG